MATENESQAAGVEPAPDLGTQLEDLFCSVWECEDLSRFEDRISLAAAISDGFRRAAKAVS